MSDRIAVMLDGHIEQLADPDTIYDSPAIRVRRRLHRPAELLRRHRPRDRSRGAGRRLDDPRRRRGARRGRGRRRPGRRSARGHHARSETQPADGENAVSGTLASVSHLGDVIQFVVMTPGRKEILARLPRPRAPRLERGFRRCGAPGPPSTRTSSPPTKPTSFWPIPPKKRRRPPPDLGRGTTHDRSRRREGHQDPGPAEHGAAGVQATLHAGRCRGPVLGERAARRLRQRQRLEPVGRGRAHRAAPAPARSRTS